MNLFQDGMTAGQMLDLIRRESRGELEKGEAFERLFARLAVDIPELEVSKIWHWKDWPDRERLTRLPLADRGIDVVAELHDGKLVAIQCKCYDENDQVDKKHLDKFLSVSNAPFDMRWIVATCKLGKTAEETVWQVDPPVKLVDFHKFDGERVSNGRFARKPRVLKEPQAEAVENVARGLIEDDEADRGQLIMACGTGKTYVSLRIAERMAAMASEGAGGGGGGGGAAGERTAAPPLPVTSCFSAPA